MIGFGVGSIAKPPLLTERYATIAGALVVPMTITKAASRWPPPHSTP